MFQTLEKLGLLLGFLGISICSYLLYTELTGSGIVCGLSSCGIVNNSKYSMFLGLPVAAWGFGFYLSVISLIITKKHRLFLLLTFIGVLFSAYLTYLEAFVIYAWCQWCLLSAWISVSLFIVALRLKKVTDMTPSVVTELEN